MTKKNSSISTINPQEIKQFEDLSAHWWNENGPLRPLHRLNPVRLVYIRDALNQNKNVQQSLTPLKGLEIADIGCGGGLVSEPLCRMGARVTGVDAGKENIKIAKAHAQEKKLDIEYIATSVEDLAKSRRKFDAITALEIIEHVNNPELFLSSCCALLKPSGVLILSTLNRTLKSYALGILAAERILRWVPKGTHHWRNFFRPSELASFLDKDQMHVTDVCGIAYHPFKNDFFLTRQDISVNYMLTAVKG